MSLPKQRPRIRPVDPYKCKHPKPVAMLKFGRSGAAFCRCMVCRKTRNKIEWQGKKQGRWLRYGRGNNATGGERLQFDYKPAICLECGRRLAERYLEP